MPTYREFREQVRRRKRKRALRRALIFVVVVAVVLAAAYGAIRLFGLPGADKSQSTAQSESTAQSTSQSQPVPESGSTSQSESTSQSQPAASLAAQGENAAWDTMQPLEKTLDQTVNSPDFRLLAVPENGQVDMKYFDRTAILGDSVSQGWNVFGTSDMKEHAFVCAYKNIGPSQVVNNEVADPGDGSGREPEAIFDTIINSNPKRLYILLGTNALVLQGNLLLATQTADALRPVARAIFEQMQDVTYTPLQVSIPLDAGAPAPGEIITVTDAYGRTMQAYIMQRTISGQKVTLESTGNARRDGTSAVNNQKWQNLQGKMLEIKADVDGLNIKASELEGDYTELSQTVDGLSVSVVKDGEVRTAFAADTSSVTISSGRVTFAANTLVVNSDNFRLTETGSVSITGMFFSLGDQDQVAIHNGALFFSRKTSDGSWKESAQLYSSGENAACGNFVLFGPGADGKQKSGVAAYTNFSGGAFAVYNAAGMPQFMVVINGDGNAEIWFNGKKIM